MRGSYTKTEATHTIWYVTLLERFTPGFGHRLELLFVTPNSIQSKPLPEVEDAHIAVAKAIREAYNELDLFQQPTEVRTNDAVLARDLVLHLRGVECTARYQKYWVRLEIARRTSDVFCGPCRSVFACETAKRRSSEIAKYEVGKFVVA